MFDNVWRHGDWATLSENDGIIIHGRSDATLNPGELELEQRRYIDLLNLSMK